MAQKVTITIEVDPTDYFGVEDSEIGAIRLVKAMVYGDVDFPYQGCKISCGEQVEDAHFGKEIG